MAAVLHCPPARPAALLSSEVVPTQGYGYLGPRVYALFAMFHTLQAVQKYQMDIILESSDRQ